MKENRKCLVCGSSTSSDPDVVLYRFPNPGTKNTLRCEKWAQYCFPNKQWASTELQKKLYSEHRMLCHKHFKQTSFINFELKKLHRHAAPEEECEQVLTFRRQNEVDAPTPHQLHHAAGPSCAKTMRDTTNFRESLPNPPKPAASALTFGQRDEAAMRTPAHLDHAVPSCAASSKLENFVCSTKREGLPNPPKPAASALTFGQRDEAAMRTPAHLDHSVPSCAASSKLENFVCSTKREGLPNPPKHAAMAFKVGKKAESTSERKYYKKSRQYFKKVCQLRNTIKKMKGRHQLHILAEDGSVKNLLKSVSPSFALLLQAQIKNHKRKPKGRRWSMEDKLVALRIYKRAPSGYRLLRRLFCLPAISSLKELLGRFELKTGTNKKVLKTLKKFSASQKPSDREFVLSFDEMSLKRHIQYNRKDDKIEGYQDHANHGRIQQEATKALVFMLTGLRKKVKQPVAFYLSSSYVTADRLAVLIKEVLHECHSFGLHISATVCDMDGVNRKALANLGANEQSPKITIDGREIITMFDTPHLLKCFCNLFMKYNIDCKTDISSNEKHGRGLAKWSDIREFHRLDNSNPNFVFAPSLKKDHLDPNAKQKMKVKLAAQVLSHTVACGIYSKVATGELPATAAVTANVVSKMDKLFDLLNSESPDLRRGKPYATNYSTTSPHKNFFKDMKIFFQDMKFLGCTRPPPSQSGWIWTLNAMDMLYENIRKKYEDVRTLATRRLQQDPLENLFGCIRGNCGSNTNPTVVQFVAGLKTAMLSNMTKISTGNCEDDKNTAVIDNIKVLLEPSTHMRTGGESPQIPSSLPSSITLSTIEDEIIDDGSGEMQACAYVCGFLLKNNDLYNTCTTCKIIYLTNEISNLHNFVESKEYKDNKKSLNYASKNFVCCVEKCAIIINERLEKDASKEALKSKITEDVNEEMFIFLKKCLVHYEQNKSYILNSVFYICVHRFCTLKNRKFSDEASALALKKKIDILQHR